MNQVTRPFAILVNRVVICFAVGLALGSYFWHPARIFQYLLDICLRAYLHFVAGSMAHEAVHGHLGNSKRANLWWGRVALIPTTVPGVTFRKTHLRHHAATNIPLEDPDEFLNTKRSWEIPLRALAMPHHWVMWLHRQNRLTRRDRIEYLVTYLVYTAVYGLIACFAGVERVLLGLLPAAILHSWILWYLFAVKTHEGYSTGTPESRSHNYYGRLLYWLSFGLSMHRLHHLKPNLAWLQMARNVPAGSWMQRVRFERDIIVDARKAA